VCLPPPCRHLDTSKYNVFIYQTKQLYRGSRDRPSVRMNTDYRSIQIHTFTRGGGTVLGTHSLLSGRPRLAGDPPTTYIQHGSSREQGSGNIMLGIRATSRQYREVSCPVVAGSIKLGVPTRAPRFSQQAKQTSTEISFSDWSVPVCGRVR
jgi:hypothetical protein